jgi:hypothetical protein
VGNGPKSGKPGGLAFASPPPPPPPLCPLDLWPLESGAPRASRGRDGFPQFAILGSSYYATAGDVSSEQVQASRSLAVLACTPKALQVSLRLEQRWLNFQGPCPELHTISTLLTYSAPRWPIAYHSSRDAYPPHLIL